VIEYIIEELEQKKNNPCQLLKKADETAKSCLKMHIFIKPFENGSKKAEEQCCNRKWKWNNFSSWDILFIVFSLSNTTKRVKRNNKRTRALLNT